MPAYRPAPRPAVKPPAPRPAMPMSRPAPRPMAKPTTPPPMGGMAGRFAAAPRPVAKPQAQPGMMGALQSRLQGARPQQKPMGQPAQVQMARPELAVLTQGPAVSKALTPEQVGLSAGGEVFTKTADNYLRPMREAPPAPGTVGYRLDSGMQSMGGGDDMGRSGFAIDEAGRPVSQEEEYRLRTLAQQRVAQNSVRPMPMQGNSFAVAPQRLDMTQRLNNMFVPGQRG